MVQSWFQWSGLSNNDRIDELLTEFDGQLWDIVLLNETMRNINEEYWTTREGHIFCGSGHNDNTRGVGILVHRRWKPFIKAFVTVSERVAYIDISRKRIRIRLVTAYFPHGGYNDKHVQQLYDSLANIKDEAAKTNKHVVIAADCNAQPGTRTDDDNPRTIGPHGLPTRNARGQWLRNWTSTHDLVLTNTFFEKQPHNYYTYIGPNKIPRQNCYIMVTKEFWRTVHDCDSNNNVDLGSDHRQDQNYDATTTDDTTTTTAQTT